VEVGVETQSQVGTHQVPSTKRCPSKFLLQDGTESRCSVAEGYVTTYSATTEANMANGPASSDDDDEDFWHSQTIMRPDDEKASSGLYPRLFNMSAGFIYQAVLRAERPDPVEYVTVQLGDLAWTDEETRLLVAAANWNMQWEAAQYRRRIFDEEELPPPIRELADRGDINITLVPRTRSRYYEYAPLFHLIPRAVLERNGLPLLHAGQWPFLSDVRQPDLYLPADFDRRLARAWASVVWGHIFRYKSPMRGFSASDPIRLLAHNLDYWIPAVTDVIQEELREWPEVDKGITTGPVKLENGTVFGGAVRANPRKGGDVWTGEEEASWIVDRTIEAADRHGHLRDILDAVRSHRVEEDFSDYWTAAREDFERKLYHKRLKVKVRFVEMTDSIPVQGPETEVVDRLVFGDFLALLNEKDREVVVLLSSGVTKLTEVAQIMGYSNHSPVSKRLERIRRQAAEFFGTV
jgi:hypothetical protein